MNLGRERDVNGYENVSMNCQEKEIVRGMRDESQSCPIMKNALFTLKSSRKARWEFPIRNSSMIPMASDFIHLYAVGPIDLRCVSVTVHQYCRLC